MKVFISWSGPLSKRLGEEIKNWLPSVIQMVTPYFTPSDIEKGSRWSSDIAAELGQSQVGILCITRDNVHSDWVLFEAGALSKSLEKAYVCPILFGITNTDLAGPLKQFQTTEFERDDFHKLVGSINKALGEKKLLQKTLDVVFDKWWPDLEQRVNEILAEEPRSEEPIRSDREILEELLQISRVASRQRSMAVSEAALEDLLSHYVALHKQQSLEEGGYQETLDMLSGMKPALRHIVRRYIGRSEKLDDIYRRFEALEYSVKSKKDGLDLDDEIPF